MKKILTYFTIWSVVALKDPSAISTIACFAVFLAHDIYGFISWRRMEKRQSAE